MKRRQDYYEEGGKLDPEKLMQGATNKYNALVAMEQWKAMTPQELQIMMLETKVQQLSQGKGGSGGGRGRNNKRRCDGDNGDGAGATAGHGQGKTKCIRDWKGDNYLEYPTWWNSTQQPKDLSKRKTFVGKTYIFCCPNSGGNCY